MAGRKREQKKASKQSNNVYRFKNLKPVDAPNRGKRIEKIQPTEEFLDKPVRWSAHSIDSSPEALGCSWDLTPKEVIELLRFLGDLSGKTWREIRAETDGRNRKRHHDHRIEDIAPAAQRRLAQLEQDEERIFRFRLAGVVRLWGFRSGDVFRILWYDRNHLVYPVNKRHT